MTEQEVNRYEADCEKHGCKLPLPIDFRRPKNDPFGRRLIAVYPNGTFPIKQTESDESSNHPGLA